MCDLMQQDILDKLRIGNFDLTKENETLKTERGRLLGLFEKVHAESQVPDDTSDIEECKKVCGFILGFAHEALNHKEG